MVCRRMKLTLIITSVRLMVNYERDQIYYPTLVTKMTDLVGTVLRRTRPPVKPTRASYR